MIAPMAAPIAWAQGEQSSGAMPALICGESGITPSLSHPIDEAVFLGDRVAIMSPRPSSVREILTIHLVRPRKLAVRATPQFGRLATAAIDVFERAGVLHEA